MLAFHSLAEEYRSALLDGDHKKARELQRQLMDASASILLHQADSELEELRDAAAHVALVADHNAQAVAGDRWRALGEVAEYFQVNRRPAECSRLADTEKPAGKVLRAIFAEPGITPTEIEQKIKAGKSDVSNNLGKLRDQRLVFDIRDGRNRRYYCTEAGLALCRKGTERPKARIDPEKFDVPPERLKLHPDPRKIPGQDHSSGAYN